jgi:hypothetical protein
LIAQAKGRYDCFIALELKQKQSQDDHKDNLKGWKDVPGMRLFALQKMRQTDQE